MKDEIIEYFNVGDNKFTSSLTIVTREITRASSMPWPRRADTINIWLKCSQGGCSSTIFLISISVNLSGIGEELFSFPLVSLLHKSSIFFLGLRVSTWKE